MGALPLSVLNAVSWAFAALAVVLTGGRFWTRCTIIKALSWDDAVHMLALLLLLAQVSIISGAASMVYHLSEDGKDGRDMSLFFRLNVAATLITWCCLYAIKISFLLLYRRIFQVSERFIQAWWIVFAIVIVTFWSLVAGVLTECGSPSALENVEYCEAPLAQRRQRVYVIYSCALNIFSDLAIMALPLAMLKNLQVRTTAKIGLAAVFCCAFITIAFDILRAVETLTRDGVVGSTALWTNLESAVAVIVSCLPSFAALFNPRNSRNAGRNASPYRPRSLIISDSAKSCMSGGSSINSGHDDYHSAAASYEKVDLNASPKTDAHTTVVSSAV